MSAVRFARARVRFPRPRLTDLDGVLTAGLAAQRAAFPRSGRIAIAVGSRGIANLHRVVARVVSTLKGWGLAPFIVPAMGSHGGATAEGQAQLIADYGITVDGVGCPIESSMDVVDIAASGLPFQLFMDRRAFEADGVVLINRIKPHTDFQGSHESGLAKMAVIGLGKARQASAVHTFGVPGLRDGIPRAASELLKTGKILAGIALVENAYDETMALEVLPPADIMARETALLEIARHHLPRLPVDALDVLIVDRIGKNLSGTGMDTNVIGRRRIAGESEPMSPAVRMIVTTDLTDESHGNATGTGLADVITRRLFDKIDVDVTYTNVATAGFPERGKIPIVAPSDEAAVQTALRACGPIAPGTERILRIRDTLHLDDVLASAAVVNELELVPHVEISDGWHDAFDAAGNLNAWPTP